MAFGQQSGPPATARQLQELLALLQRAGHDGFKDARGPMGFTQRQAAGKFTRDEASAFIEQLQAELEEPDLRPLVADEPPAPTRPAPTASAGPVARRRAQQAPLALRDVPSDQLAAELQRRGWIVMAP